MGFNPRDLENFIPVAIILLIVPWVLVLAAGIYLFNPTINPLCIIGTFVLVLIGFCIGNNRAR